MRHIIKYAMDNPDNVVVKMTYTDRNGAVTKRVVSPIAFTKSDRRFRALCLCREEPRVFRLDRCTDVCLAQASDYVMPVPIVVIKEGEE